jgi:hypothetical protein
MVRPSDGRLSLQRRTLLGVGAITGLVGVLPGLANSVQPAVIKSPLVTAKLESQVGSSSSPSDQDYDVPFVVTPQAVVDVMLEMAQFKPGIV